MDTCLCGPPWCERCRVWTEGVAHTFCSSQRCTSSTSAFVDNFSLRQASTQHFHEVPEILRVVFDKAEVEYTGTVFKHTDVRFSNSCRRQPLRAVSPCSKQAPLVSKLPLPLRQAAANRSRIPALGSAAWSRLSPST
eukprot:364768-Chlamydomonas_euryale.AAC.12